MNKCPFSGQPCHKQQSYQVTDLKDGKFFQSVKICEDCFITHYQNEQPKLPDTALIFKAVFELLNSIFTGVALPKNQTVQIKPQKKCPKCGHTIDDILETHKLGCPECYNYFQTSMHGVLQKVQEGEVQHVGKVPKNISYLTIEGYTELLQQRLNDAVIDERYEDATSVKNILFALEALKKRLKESISTEDYQQAHLIRQEIQKFIDQG